LFAVEQTRLHGNRASIERQHRGVNVDDEVESIECLLAKYLVESGHNSDAFFADAFIGGWRIDVVGLQNWQPVAKGTLPFVETRYPLHCQTRATG